MRAFLATVSFFALAGCGEEAPPTAETPPAGEADAAAVATVSAPRDNCKDIATLATAMTESEPFASLRTGNVMLGDHKVEDSFTTDVSPAGAACKLGKMSGWNPGDADTYVVNCTLFSSGVFDEEENGIKAKAVFDAAKAQLDSCLPPGWTPRDGGNNGDERTEALIYETAADIARRASSDFYVYPVELNKEYYTGSMRGGKTPGWNVTLNFQTSGAAPAAPAAN